MKPQKPQPAAQPPQQVQPPPAKDSKDTKTQPPQQKPQVKIPETVPESPPKHSTKNELDQIQKTKHMMLEYQEKYFESLKSKQDNISSKLSLRNAQKVEDKILNAIRKGVLQLENSKFNYVEGHMMDKKVLNVEKEKDQLQSKLQNIDNELSTLKKQKINNPFSAYSQPNLKLLQQEENLQKQLEAEEKIFQINQEAHTRREKKHKLQTEQQQKLTEEEKHRLQQEESKAHEIKLQLQQQLKDHIAELKHRHENRLKEMDKQEQDYFNTLNQKLKKLAAERKHLSNLEVPKDQIEPFRVKLEKGQKKKQQQLTDSLDVSISKIQKEKGLSLTPKHKQSKKLNLDDMIEIERPLYLRIKEDYEKKMKDEDDQILKQRSEKLQFSQKYSVDYEEHLQKYKNELKQKKREFKERRMKQLAKLGLEHGKFSTNVNASFDSKLWLLQESQINKSVDDISMVPKELQITMAKEKRNKILDYDKQIKEKIKIGKDEDLEIEVLVQKDKLKYPQNYIINKPSIIKDAEKLREMEIEIYRKSVAEREQLEQERKEREKEKFKKMKEKIKKEIMNLGKKEKDKEKVEQEEYEREPDLATKNGGTYLKDFKNNHQQAIEQERVEKIKRDEYERKQELKEKKRQDKLPQLTKSTKSLKERVKGTLERPDYWEEVKSKFNLEEKAKSQIDIEKIMAGEIPKTRSEIVTQKKLEELNKQINLPKIERPATDDVDKQEEYLEKRRKLHNKRVDAIKKKKQIEDETKDTRDTYRRLNDAVNQLDIQAKKQDDIVNAQFTQKPLRALEKAQELDEQHYNIIQAKFQNDKFIKIYQSDLYLKHYIQIYIYKFVTIQPLPFQSYI
ncbi:hypothetical protein pb186bvf_012321 [Paramecium bursaria]